jgi:DNA-binding transcriptional ArsR family regulator
MTATTGNCGPGYRLRVDTPDTLAVSIVMSPQQSVVCLLLQAATGHPLGAPADLLAAVGKALRPQSRFAAHPFATSRYTVLPECLTPIPPLADTSVLEQADRLRELAPEVFIRDLTMYGEHDFPPGWEAAGQQPRRWLNSLADASLDIWALIEPWWRAAGPLFDRELRRVGTAAVRGGLVALLNSLHPRISYRDGTLVFAVPGDRCLPLGRRRLVLLPMISGRESLLVSFEGDDVCYIGYPVRPPGPSPQVPLASANGALALILGPLRAAALRALRQSLNVGELAVAVQCAPTTATYHVHHLAAAGLVSCERRGSSILVSRTARGDELVDLLAG